MKYDVTIIGGGPAGVSAALYAARGGLSVCITDGGASALTKAESIQNYYGAGTVSGRELYERGLMQAKEIGVAVLCAEVTHIEQGDGFTAFTTAGEVSSDRLVIATGASRVAADIDGIAEYTGRGVSYCAVCDAFFYRKKRVAVIGAGEYARHEYDVLAPLAGEAYLLTDGKAVSGAPQNTVNTRIKRIVGGERVTGVEFEDGTRIDVDGVFVALGVMGAFAIAKNMGVMTDVDGNIIVDGRGMTNIPGVYAAGDCTAGIKQVAKAVYDGLAVGMSIIKDVQNGD